VNRRSRTTNMGASALPGWLTSTIRARSRARCRWRNARR
jgi:hypothetical protein